MKVPDFARVARFITAAEEKWGHEVMLMADMAALSLVLLQAENIQIHSILALMFLLRPLIKLYMVLVATLFFQMVTSLRLRKPEKTLENLPILIDRAVFGYLRRAT